MKKHSVIAICGKGGVGKTALSGILVRIMAESGLNVLAVDADPAMGLAYILGLDRNIKTLGNVREDLIRTARSNKDPDEVADSADYLVMETLIETEKYSFLAMGRSLAKGCFCPVNTLLKDSINELTNNYDVILMDAEAGIEQLNREVMSEMDNIVVVVDSSQRSIHSMELIQQIMKDLHLKAQVGVVLNRLKNGADKEALKHLPTAKISLWGALPEDEELRINDAVGKSVFELPDNSPLLESAKQIANFLISNESSAER